MHSHQKRNIKPTKFFIIQYLSGDFGYTLFYQEFTKQVFFTCYEI